MLVVLTLRTSRAGVMYCLVLNSRLPTLILLLWAESPSRLYVLRAVESNLSSGHSDVPNRIVVDWYMLKGVADLLLACFESGRTWRMKNVLTWEVLWHGWSPLGWVFCVFLSLAVFLGILIRTEPKSLSKESFQTCKQVQNSRPSIFRASLENYRYRNPCHRIIPEKLPLRSSRIESTQKAKDITLRIPLSFDETSGRLSILVFVYLRISDLGILKYPASNLSWLNQDRKATDGCSFRNHEAHWIYQCISQKHYLNFRSILQSFWNPCCRNLLENYRYQSPKSLSRLENGPAKFLEIWLWKIARKWSISILI